MEMKIRKLNVHYKDEGEGPVFVVLHGWGASIPTMQPVINALKGKGRIIAVDLPGFGKSEEPKEVFGGLEYAEVVLELMDELNIEKFSLIGHSFGGKTSILLAARHPERVEKVMLIDSAGLIPKRSAKYYVKVYSFKALRWMYKHLFFWVAKEERVKSFYEKFGSTDYKNADGVMRKVLVKVVNEDFTEELSKIKAPTLLFWGDQDQDTPLYMAHKMEKHIKDAGLVVAEGAGHYAYLDNYPLFVAVLNAFFK